MLAYIPDTITKKYTVKDGIALSLNFMLLQINTNNYGQTGSDQVQNQPENEHRKPILGTSTQLNTTKLPPPSPQHTHMQTPMHTHRHTHTAVGQCGTIPGLAIILSC